jgi:succinate dehydrogenase / fumarate reductase cytochrome b subunit
VSETPVSEALPSTFLSRNEFLLRRLHSLSGVIPVGAYMVVHLLTNSSVLDSPMTFQRNVYAIHSLGMILPVVEWVFIFLPLLFHAIFGVIIIRGGLPNNSTYKYTNNMRYTLQRVTGMIAFVFIVWHVFHMHGWIHAKWWTEGIATPLWGHVFRPFNASSTAAEAIAVPGFPATALVVQILYAIGILSCVFHLANGIWTFGITWGIWITPQAQQRATVACAVFGVALSLVGLSALAGFATKSKEDIELMREAENKNYESRVASGEIVPIKDPHFDKRWHAPKEDHAKAPATTKP